MGEFRKTTARYRTTRSFQSTWTEWVFGPFSPTTAESHQTLGKVIIVVGRKTDQINNTRTIVELTENRILKSGTTSWPRSKCDQRAFRRCARDPVVNRTRIKIEFCGIITASHVFISRKKAWPFSHIIALCV